MNDWKLVNSKDVSIYDDFAEIYNPDDKKSYEIKVIYYCRSNCNEWIQINVDTYKELTLCKRIFTTYALFNSNEYAQIRLIEL